MSNLQINLDIEEIKRMYLEEFKTINEIAKYFSVSDGTIKLRLVNSNISLRTHSENQKIVMNRPEVLKKTSESSKRSSKQRMNTNLKRHGAVVAANGPEIKPKWQAKHLEKYDTI